jgi:phosphatidate phosphatase APP1
MASRGWQSAVISFALVTASFAYTIDGGVIPGGGANNLQSADKSITLIDVKGQTVIGDSTGGGWTVQPGSLYGLFVPKGTISGTLKRPDGTAYSSTPIRVTVAGLTFTTVTDSLGAFTIAGVPAGTWAVLIATQTGYYTSLPDVTVTANNTTTLAGLPNTLQSRGTLTGILKNQTGGLLANTPVTVTVDGIVYTTVTNAAGNFQIWGVPTNVRDISIATADGHYVEYKGFNIPAETGLTGAGTPLGTAGSVTTEVTAGTISGTLVDNLRGFPLFNTPVTVRAGGKTYTTTTDDQGNFSVPGVAPGTYTVAIATRDGHYVELTGITVGAGAPTLLNNVSVSVTRGTLIGSLLLPDGTTPLANTPVTVNVAGQNYTATTDDWGRFTIPGVPPGSNYTVTVSTKNNQTASKGNIAVTAGVVTNLGPLTLSVLEVPPGTVKLYISRVNSDIRITWEAARYEALPKIYILTGGGSGEYNNTAASWRLLTDGQPDVTPGGTTVSISSGLLTHQGQVGGGTAEAYYKGLLQSSADLSYFIPSAEAVGKVNVQLVGGTTTPGFNLICVPFAYESTTVADIFGVGSPWQDGDQILKKTGPSPSYVTTVYDSAHYSGAPWRDAGNTLNAPGFNLDTNYGNFAVVRNSKTITVLGRVLRSPVSVAVWGSGYTPLSLIFPARLALAASGLFSGAAGAANGDVIYNKTSAISPSYIGAVLVGGVWKDVSNTNNTPPAGIATLSLPNSYFFNRLNSTGFSWQRPSP